MYSEVNARSTSHLYRINTSDEPMPCSGKFHAINNINQQSTLFVSQTPMFLCNSNKNSWLADKSVFTYFVSPECPVSEPPNKTSSIMQGDVERLIHSESKLLLLYNPNHESAPIPVESHLKYYYRTSDNSPINCEVVVYIS